MPKTEQKPAQQKRQYKPRTPAPPVTSPGDFVWQNSQKSNSGSFEDMMSKFKQTSEDKISDLKRSSGESRGYSRRGNSSKK
jgi:S1 RNA binding domain protein